MVALIADNFRDAMPHLSDRHSAVRQRITKLQIHVGNAATFRCDAKFRAVGIEVGLRQADILDALDFRGEGTTTIIDTSSVPMFLARSYVLSSTRRTAANTIL